ncbi:MAG: hypothetical protein QOD33_231 [Pyrinomonadaceae bacterium]|nr:hypothetical protein [Pyrinomonadaceae bacterium]
MGRGARRRVISLPRASQVHGVRLGEWLSLQPDELLDSSLQYDFQASCIFHLDCNPKLNSRQSWGCRVNLKDGRSRLARRSGRRSR